LAKSCQARRKIPEKDARAESEKMQNGSDVGDQGEERVGSRKYKEDVEAILFSGMKKKQNNKRGENNRTSKEPEGVEGGEKAGYVKGGLSKTPLTTRPNVLGILKKKALAG